MHTRWLSIVVVLVSIQGVACESSDDAGGGTPGMGRAAQSNSMDTVNPAVDNGQSPGTTTGATGMADTTGMPDVTGTENTMAGNGAMPMDTAADPEPVDYSVAENWLCRPGHNGACEVDLRTTVIAADGTLTPEAFTPHASPPVDCFYVYPTVSLDETGNSDLVPGPEELSVVKAQFARLASQCRLFAPMYRQITLTALRAILAGGTGAGAPPSRALAYGDVLAAWQHYLENDNDGRGVVLIGHSQGSMMLSRLVEEELDQATLDPRFMSVHLIGTSVLVPEDGVVGGTFQHVPLCQAADQLGCVISYASFRAESPPPEDALFATSSEAGMVAACTNPAALGGGSGELHAYLSKDGPGPSSGPMGAWIDDAEVTTPFVSVPGLLTAECVFGTSGSYLAIDVQGDPADPRTDTITGDVVIEGSVAPDWGLHLIDVHLGMGNLEDIIAAQAAAHAAR